MSASIYRPNQGLDALRIQAEIETANKSPTKRPTWAPAVVLDGELLDLCREVGFLGVEEKPVARLWAVFADPKRKGTVIRANFSQHPLDGVRCRGFEMRAGEKHDGCRLTNALMQRDGSWSTGHLSWRRSDIRKMRYRAKCLEQCIESNRRALQPESQPHQKPPLSYEGWIANGATPERAQELARESMEYLEKDYAERLKRWEDRERKRKDLDYIARLQTNERKFLGLLEKQKQEIAKEEANPDWRYKALTRMTDLATQRLHQFVGDPEAERRRGAAVTGSCFCCGKTLTDKISLERGIGPECVQNLRTFDLIDLVRLKEEMVAAHPDKGGRHEAFLAAYAKYAAAKEAAERSLPY